MFALFCDWLKTSRPFLTNQTIKTKTNSDLAASHFGRDGYATESEQLKTREKRGDYRKFYCFGLPLRYRKGVQFCSRYMEGVPF